MNIGIDIDDTLTFLQNIKIETAQNYISKHNMNFQLVKADSHLFSEMFNWPIEECDRFWFEEAEKMLAEVKARDFASETIKKLKNAGHKIIIITARTKEWHKEPFQEAYDWLKKNNIYFDELFVGHMDKTQICLENKIDVFIDDMPKTLIKLQAHGIETIMMENPHNKNQTIYNGKTARNWQEIGDMLVNMDKNLI